MSSKLTEAPIKAPTQRKNRRRSGTAMVEMAIAMPVLLLLLLGMLEFGLIFSRYQVVLTSAREGARVASLYRLDCDPNQVFQEVVAAVTNVGSEMGMNLSNSSPKVNVSVQNTCVRNQNALVRVDYTHSIDLLAGMLSETSNITEVELSAAVLMRNEI